MAYSLLRRVLCVASLAWTIVSAQENTCPVLGSDLQSLQNFLIPRNVTIYLNFESPSQCRGTVTSYEYCFYDSVVDDVPYNSTYEAKLMIYRRSSTNSSIYTPVPGSIRNLTLSRDDADGMFECRDEMLLESFEIQENDVLGACVMDIGTVKPLNLVGENSMETDYFLYEVTTPADCTDCTDSTESLYTEDSQLVFTKRRNLVLHLQANIGATSLCHIGTNPRATASMTSSVEETYLNTDSPLACTDGNAITSWHYCYYTSAVTPGQTYTMTVAVWRLDTNTYRVTAGSSRTITLVPVATLARIFCMEETLDSADSVFVMVGDVIGVVLPSSNPIPVVSFDPSSNSSLMRRNQSVSAMDLLSSELNSLTGAALHLYANLESVPPASDESMTEIMTSDVVATTTETSAPPATDDQVTTESITSTTTDRLAITEMPMTDARLSTNTEMTTRGSAEEDSSSTGLIVAIVVSITVAILIVLSITLSIVIVYKQRRKKSVTIAQPVYYNVQRPHRVLVKEDSRPYENMISGEYLIPITSTNFEQCLNEVRRGSAPQDTDITYQSPAQSEGEIYDVLRRMQIPSIAGSNVKIGEELGSGQFGMVRRGRWTVNPENTIPVAVKTMRTNFTMTERIEFLQEGAIMAQFRHPNVVTLYGVTEKNQQSMLVVELLSKGDLNNYLRALKSSPGELENQDLPQTLLNYSQQIALGMNYLSSIGFVHRDLAARNILVSECNICKIADFGMSRRLQDTDHYTSRGGKVPIKWTAPEAVNYKTYSTASDVWSYGCVLYEIWSLGAKPYKGMGNREVLRKVEDGYRLPPPPGCPMHVYRLMIKSWGKEPKDRPSFWEVLLSLLEEESVVLMMPPEEAGTHPEAAVLGATLEAGERMYMTLQNTYREET